MKYIILFETENTGKIFGQFLDYEDAENTFHMITEDILSKLPSVDNLFFKLYGIFEMPLLNLEYELYRISSHKNQILDYKLIFSLNEFALYLIKFENDFDIQKLKRNEKQLFFSKSNFLEGSIEIIMN